LGLAELLEPVRADLEDVETRVRGARAIARRRDPRKSGRYLQQSGGKRIRPAVLLMVGRLCGYRGERAILYASVVEFIHTATLVHDDIIDESELPARPACRAFAVGQRVTVLVGDYLLHQVDAMALTQDSLDVIRVLCDVTLKMIEGELYQLTKNGRHRHHRERAPRHHPPQDRIPVRGLRGNWRLPWEHRSRTPGALREYGFNLGSRSN